MLCSSGIPFIEVKMLLTGGKVEGLPRGGQRHCADTTNNRIGWHRVLLPRISNRTLAQWQWPFWMVIVQISVSLNFIWDFIRFPTIKNLDG